MLAEATCPKNLMQVLETLCHCLTAALSSFESSLVVIENRLDPKSNSYELDQSPYAGV